jgi:spermine/spermidine synthase
MAVGFDHPKSKTHVGDGFKFLDDYKNSFDVIITDSSDPEGPAESLFQKPYFKLLHDALREGGVITTQGCTFPNGHAPPPPLPQRVASKICSRYPLFRATWTRLVIPAPFPLLAWPAELNCFSLPLPFAPPCLRGFRVVDYVAPAAHSHCALPRCCLVQLGWRSQGSGL